MQKITPLIGKHEIGDTYTGVIGTKFKIVGKSTKEDYLASNNFVDDVEIFGPDCFYITEPVDIEEYNEFMRCYEKYTADTKSN